MKANPEVMFRKVRLHCLMDIEPRHRCYTRNHVRVIQHPLEHAQVCRLPDKSKFVIAQPKCTDEPCGACDDAVAEWRAIYPDIELRKEGSERSWHHPSSTKLAVIGNQDTLAKMRLDYPVPVRNAPVNCVMYKRG